MKWLYRIIYFLILGSVFAAIGVFEGWFKALFLLLCVCALYQLIRFLVWLEEKGWPPK